MRVVKKPNLTIDSLDRTFFKAAAIEAKKRIRKRTESKKVDYEEKAFKAYSPGYKKYRSEKGRSTTPNLSFTGKMLSAMSSWATAKKGVISFSGFYSKIVQGNEARGRIFFALSSSDEKSIMKMVDRWMAKKNGLK